LTIEVVGVDNDLPTIIAIVDPAPDTAGWNNSVVTVRFECSDQGSGIASCPDQVVVNTDGSGQIISGTATDLAGNSASTSITINLDQTTPTITAILTPPANANGWNNQDVTVSYSCDDLGSGISNCSTPNVVVIEGAGQIINGSATDLANTATTSLTLNIDKNAPVITLTSPAAGSIVTASPINIIGSVIDTYSLESVTINAIHFYLMLRVIFSTLLLL